MKAMMSTSIITWGTGGPAEVIANTNQAPSTSPTNIPIAIANHPHLASSMLVLLMAHCQEMYTVWTTLLEENRVSI